VMGPASASLSELTWRLFKSPNAHHQLQPAVRTISSRAISYVFRGLTAIQNSL